MEISSQHIHAAVNDSEIVIPLSYFEMCLIQISLSRQFQRATARRHDPLEVQYDLLTTSCLPLLRLQNRLSTEAGHLHELAPPSLKTDTQVQVSFSPQELDMLIAGLEHYRIDLLMEDARLGPSFSGLVKRAETHRLPPFSTENGKLLRLAPLVARLCTLKAEWLAVKNPLQALVQVLPENRLIWQDRKTWSQVSLSQPVQPLFRDKGIANRYVVWRTTQEVFACRRVGNRGVQSAPVFYRSRCDAKAVCERHYLTEIWE